jgi:hypothetical protein
MNRRAFMQTTATAVAVTATASLTAEEEGNSTELYELKRYTLEADKADKLPILDTYLSTALLPALKRLGIGPVGVFVEKKPDDKKKDVVMVYVLTVYSSGEQLLGLSGRLAGDGAYTEAAGAYLNAPADKAVYKRIDSSLLRPIEGLAHLQKPDTSHPRLFNLRIYESHNERAAKKKIEMFNKAELAIFRRVGLTPVFFGETLVGSTMPNLTYMLVFPDEAGRKTAWDRFRADPEWLKLKAIPEYADKEIVSNITNLILTPTSYSQI